MVKGEDLNKQSLLHYSNSMQGSSMQDSVCWTTGGFVFAGQVCNWCVGVSASVCVPAACVQTGG